MPLWDIEDDDDDDVMPDGKLGYGTTWTGETIMIHQRRKLVWPPKKPRR
jgi:hypothetical protein